MIRVTSLGGSGEDSRNCFLAEIGEHTVLLDCGVRREIADVSVVYPLLTRETAKRLDAVVISHAHEDHTAALPYLYELGYRGPVYASPETIALIPSFLKKWIGYVRHNKGTLPFDHNNADRIRFLPVSEIPFPVTFGRDGHVAGGLWFRFEAEGRSLLYTGDLTCDSLVLEADPLPEADLLVIDSAYAGKRLVQQDQYGRLLETARRVTASGGRLLLPVPANGRGIDMLVYLSRFGLPLYAESDIVKNTAALAAAKDWIRPFEMPDSGYTPVNDGNRSALLVSGAPGIFLFGDGMLTSAVSAEYLAAVLPDPRSEVIISGHSAKGTPANDLLSEDFRKEYGVLAAVSRLTVKVHNDDADVLSLVSRVRPQKVMLFHSRAEACSGLAGKLAAQGIPAVCAVGQTMAL